MPFENDAQRAASQGATTESETLSRLRILVDGQGHLHQMIHNVLIPKLDALDKGQDRILHEVAGLKETVMATQAELTAEVKAIGEKLTKIGTETSALLTMIEELKGLAVNASPELQEAVEAVAAQAQIVDDLVPDAPTPEPASAKKKP